MDDHDRTANMIPRFTNVKKTYSLKTNGVQNQQCSVLFPLKWWWISGRSRISKRGTPTPEGGCQPIIWPTFAENCMNMKKFWPRGGTRPSAPRSATVNNMWRMTFSLSFWSTDLSTERSRLFSCCLILLKFLRHRRSTCLLKNWFSTLRLWILNLLFYFSLTASLSPSILPK